MAGGLLTLPVSEDESSTRLATHIRGMQGESPTVGRARPRKNSYPRSSTPGVEPEAGDRHRFLHSQVVRSEPLGHPARLTTSDDE